MRSKFVFYLVLALCLGGTAYLVRNMFGPDEASSTSNKATAKKSSGQNTSSIYDRFISKSNKSRTQNTNTSERSIWTSAADNINTVPQNTNSKIYTEIQSLIGNLQSGDEKSFEKGMLELKEKNPNDFRPSAALADFYFDRQKFEEAEPHFRDLIKAKPDHYLARNTFGDMLASQGRLEEAQKTYQDTIEVSGGNFYAIQSYLTTSALLGKDKEAVEYIKARYQQDPTRTTLRLARAQIALMEQDTALYEDLNKRIDQDDPTNPLRNRDKMMDAFIEGDMQKVLQAGENVVSTDVDLSRKRDSLRMMIEAARRLEDQKTVSLLQERLKATF